MRVVAELMIAANAAVAARVRDAFPSSALLRRHAPPRTDGFELLAGLCDAEGVRLDASSGETLSRSLDEASRLARDPAAAELFRGTATRAMSEAQYVSAGGATTPGRGRTRALRTRVGALHALHVANQKVRGRRRAQTTPRRARARRKRDVGRRRKWIGRESDRSPGKATDAPESDANRFPSVSPPPGCLCRTRRSRRSPRRSTNVPARVNARATEVRGALSPRAASRTTDGGTRAGPRRARRRRPRVFSSLSPPRRRSTRGTRGCRGCRLTRRPNDVDRDERARGLVGRAKTPPRRPARPRPERSTRTRRTKQIRRRKRRRARGSVRGRANGSTGSERARTSTTHTRVGADVRGGPPRARTETRVDAPGPDASRRRGRRRARAESERERRTNANRRTKNLANDAVRDEHRSTEHRDERGERGERADEDDEEEDEKEDEKDGGPPRRASRRENKRRRAAAKCAAALSCLAGEFADMRLVDDDAFDDDGMHRWRRRVEDGRSHASVVGDRVGVVDGSGTVATLRRRWWRAACRAAEASVVASATRASASDERIARRRRRAPPPRGYAPPPRGARWSKPSRRSDSRDGAA